MSSLENLFVSDSYDGLLHSNASPLSANKQTTIFDGSGQASALKLGLSGNGATISGTLSSSSLKVGTLSYPLSSTGTNSIMVDSGGGVLRLLSSLPPASFPDLSPNPSGTYERISKVTVNSKGLVTSVTTLNGGGNDDPSPGGNGVSTTSTNVFMSSRTQATYRDIVLPTSGWTFYKLPTRFPGEAKVVTGFIRSRLVAKRQQQTIYASPDNGANAFPILFSRGGEDAGGGIDFYGNGSQFSVPVGIKNGDLGFWLKREDSGSIPISYHDIWVNGYQI